MLCTGATFAKKISYLFAKIVSFDTTGAKLGDEEKRPPLPVLKVKKSAQIWEKRALILSIFELNFPFNV